MMTGDPPLRRWRDPEVGLALAVLAGTWLRTYQITDQILADDEWHALYALHLRTYASVLSHFGEADYSIPLTVLYKALAGTVGLSELAMRAPMLACGVATLVALPLLVREYVGRRASVVFAWLLAISPLHVYFSRYARPYVITMLLALLAVFAFVRWSGGGRRRWAWVYALSAIGAPYFHLAVLPAVLAPLLFGVVERVAWRDRSGARSLGELAQVGATVGLGLAVLLVVPLVVDAGSLGRKTGQSTIGTATVKGAAQLLAGTAEPWLLGAVAALVLGGWVWLARRQPRLTAYAAFLAACLLAVPVVTRPAGITVSIVLARYCLPLLPLGLLGAAAGLVQLETALQRRVSAWPAGGLAVVAVGLLLGFGPLPAVYYSPNNWTSHALFQYEYDPTSPYSYVPAVRPRRISPFYTRLGALPAGSLLIVEAPWYYAWHQIPFPYYQQVHRQRMNVGFVAAADQFVRPGELPLVGSGLHFDNAVHVADAAKLKQRGVRYVVFHRSLRAELPSPPEEVIDVGEWIRRYAVRYGAPVYEDPDIVAFDVAAGPGTPPPGADVR